MGKVSKVLEPLRRFHSAKHLTIEGVVPEQCRTSLYKDMTGPPPSDDALFYRSHGIYHSAIDSFASGEFALSVHKLTEAVDEMRDLCMMIGRPLHVNAEVEIQTGPFSGVPFEDMIFKMNYQLDISLAMAYLELSDLEGAQKIVTGLFARYLYVNGLPAGAILNRDEYTKMFELQAQIFKVTEPVDPDLDTFGMLVSDMQEAIDYGGSNPILEYYLEKYKKEQASREEITDLMQIVDRCDDWVRSQRASRSWSKNGNVFQVDLRDYRDWSVAFSRIFTEDHLSGSEHRVSDQKLEGRA